MAKSSTNVNNGGIGFFGALTITFIVLKLTGYVDWSWFWVLSPIIIPIIVIVLLILIGTIISVITKS